jgi:hypothetical protein
MLDKRDVDKDASMLVDDEQGASSWWMERIECRPQRQAFDMN